MTKKSIAQGQGKDRQTHFFYRWYVLRTKENEGELDEQEIVQMRRLQAPVIRNTHEVYVFLLAKYRGLFTEEEWEMAKWLVDGRRISLANTMLARMMGHTETGTHDDYLNLMRTREESKEWLVYECYLAEGKDDRAVQYLKEHPQAAIPPSLKDWRAQAQERTPLNDALARRAGTSPANASTPFPTGSNLGLLGLLLAMLRGTTEPIDENTTEPLPADLPDGGELADLLDFAFAHDMGLLD